METSTLFLLGIGAFLLFEFGIPGGVVSNLKFLENGMSLDVSNPLRVVVNLSILIQNPTSGSITLQSIAGYFYINGSQAGNVSNFTPVAVAPNSETPMNLQLSVNDISLVGIIMNYINGSSDAVVVEIKATANANNVPIPVDLSFQPIN